MDLNKFLQNPRTAKAFLQKAPKKTPSTSSKFEEIKKRLEKLGIKRTTITQRIDAYGWSLDRALTA